MGVGRPWLATVSPQQRATEIYTELSKLRMDLAGLSETVPPEFRSVMQPLIDLIAESIDRGLTLLADQGKNLADAPDGALDQFGQAPTKIKDSLHRLSLICARVYGFYCNTLAVRQGLRQSQPID